MSLFDNKNTKKTPISSLGEFGLIDHLTQKFKLKNSCSIKGVGDDTAVITNGKKYRLFSTDLLIEGIHFDLAYTPLKHLGYKSVAVNVSDICAMNGLSKQITVGLAVSNRFTIESLEEFYAGINLACEHYGVDLVGGDTTSSKSGLMISVSILGEVQKDKICYRSGAEKNDLIVVTGDLGAAYFGLQILKREKSIFLENPTIQPDLSGHDYVLQRQLKPEAGVRYLKILKDLNVKPSSMIDVSDGLASELLHLSKASDIGITIYEEKIPIDYTVMNLAKELNLNPIFCALNGGEDYELLFTISQKEYEKFKKDVDFTIIGYVNEKSEGNNFITKDGSLHKLTAQGWDAINEAGHL